MSYERPNAASNNAQASVGSQIWGIVESMKAEMGVGRREVVVEALVVVIPSIRTVRSRASSSLKLNVTFPGINLDAS